MGDLRYCFEQECVAKTLEKTRKAGLAVIDSDGVYGSDVSKAVNRGVFVYDYVNVGALETGRAYYQQFQHLRLAKYEGWSGEYWIDPTAPEWRNHIIETARKKQRLGVIGLYLDNTDIYYMVRHIKKQYRRDIPDQDAVYRALRDIVIDLTGMGLIVMPNGGDLFVRKFVAENPGIIRTINQEGCLYEDFHSQPSSERKYRTAYMDWAKRQGLYVRGIEYTKTAVGKAKCKTYYKLHGWQGLYVSKHTDLRGD